MTNRVGQQTRSDSNVANPFRRISFPFTPIWQANSRMKVDGQENLEWVEKSAHFSVLTAQ